MFGRFAAAIWVGLALCVGCQGQRAASLLTVSGVSPRLVEPGDTLRIDGEGFAAGRACALTFAGKTFRAAAKPLPVRGEVDCYAEAEDRVRARLDAALFRALGEHGTFAGEITVAFDAPAGGRVSGSTQANLDLLQPMARGAARRDELHERARDLVAQLGLSLDPDAAVVEGLRVRWAADGSVAQRAGIARGDRIVRASGVGVHALGDLVPPPGSARLQLEVRDSRGGSRVHALALRSALVPDVERGLWRIGALSVLLLLCIAFLSPLPTPAHLLARVASRLAHAPASREGVFGGSLGGGRRGRAYRVLKSGTLTVWGGLLVHGDPLGLMSLSPLPLYGAAAAFAVTWALLRGGSPLARARRVAHLAGQLLAFALVVGCASALAGSAAPAALVSAQGPWPFQWAVFAQPALLAAFPLYFVTASRLTAEGAHAPRPAVRVVLNVACSVLGVLVFFGGTRWPDLLTPSGWSSGLLGSAAFALKVWLLALALHHARRIELGGGPQPILWLAAVLAPALSAVSLWWQPAPAVTAVIGATLCVTAIACALIALLIWLRDPAPMGEPPTLDTVTVP